MIYRFSSTKKIPKSLDECKQIDDVSANLWAWAERIDTIGLVYSIIVALIAFIAILVNYGFSYFLLALLAAPIVFIVSYAGFFAVSLILAALASITQNTCVSANVALYEASIDHPDQTTPQKAAPSVAFSAPKKVSFQTENSQVSSGKWECKNCLTYNNAEHTHCKECGKSRY